MLLVRKFAISFAALCLAGALPGKDGSPESLSLERCIAIAVERHPLILAAEERRQAAVARIPQATAWTAPAIEYNPDMQPQFGNIVDAEETYLGVSQTFELPRKRAARGRIAEQESLEVETDKELVRLEIVFAVRQSFYEVLRAQDQLGYARQDLRLAEEFLQMAELKLAAGDVAKVELLRAKLETLRATNAVKVAENDLSLAKARLNYHLARPPGTPLAVEGQLQMPFAELDLDQLQAEARRQRPEIQRLRLSVEREGFVQENARLSSLPDPDFSVSRHWLKGLPTTWSFSVAVPLPFLFQQRQKAEIAESQANARALQRESEQTENMVAVEVKETYTNARAARDQILMYQREILPQAQEVLEMYSFSYREGEIGGIELIEARRTLNESRKAYADALYEYAVALATIDKAVGRQP